MKIFIYVTGQPKDLITNLINRLDAAGVAFFIDKNVPTRQWYQSNLEGNCRVFNNVFEYYDADYPTPFVPFILCAAEYDEDPNWEEIKETLMNDNVKIQTAPIQKQGIKRRAEEYINEDGMTVERVDPGKKVKDSSHYDLDIYHDKDHDTMFYEMTKPYDTRPWTAVTKDFAKRGHLPFFSSYFYLNSFGKCGQDIDFLTYCWEKWNMPGRMILEELVAHHIENCKEDETLSPRVYQNDTRSLINLFNINQWP